MEYCPTRNKSTLEITVHSRGLVSLSRCSYLKEIAQLRFQDFKDLDLFSLEYNDFLRKKSSPLCNVNCTYLNNTINNIVVGISKKCNLNCYHCFNDVHKDTDIEKEFYFYVLDKIKGHHLNSLLLGSQGEVFTYYDEIVKYLKSLSTDDFKTIILQTNATLLTDERIQELNDISQLTGVNYQFFISFSGITKETYEKTQVGANYEKTLKNVLLLLDAFSSKNVRITFVIKRTNITDVLNIKTFFNDLGIDQIDITYDLYDFGCREVYDKLITGDLGKCIYDSYKKEKCASSLRLKKYKFIKNNVQSIREVREIYNNKIQKSNFVLKPLEEIKQNISNTFIDEDKDNYNGDSLLTVGITMHGNQELSNSITEAIESCDKINWIISNDKPTESFYLLQEKLKNKKVLFVEASPGIENNRQNILNYTQTKYLYVIDYDDDLKINQNKLLNFLSKIEADIIHVKPLEDNKSTSNYIYYNDTTIFVTTWAQIFETSFLRKVGGYIQTWNFYHEEFGTNANMLANIYVNNIKYKLIDIPENCIFYNHILSDADGKHNSQLKYNIREYIKFIKGIPKNEFITYKVEFIELFKMRLNLMNLSQKDYKIIIKNIEKIGKKL